MGTYMEYNCGEVLQHYVIKEANRMPTEKEIKVIEKATLYDLRLIFSNGEKENYSKEEIMELLDKIAMAKDQE